jgi:hypothetical protein
VLLAFLESESEIRCSIGSSVRKPKDTGASQQTGSREMDIESARLLLQAISTAAVVIALAFTARQIKIATSTYHDLHEWNRRKAAQDAISEYRLLSEDVVQLDRVFKTLSTSKPVSLQEALEAFETEPRIRASVHKILNYYENLANGLRHHVLNEQIIKSYFRTNMATYFREFEAYIRYQRGSGSPRVWVELEETVRRWEEGERVIGSTPTGR